MLLITAVLLVMGMTGNEITFIEGVILWILFIAYLLYLYFLAKKGNDSGDEQSVKLYPVWKCLLFIVLGGVRRNGSQLVVNGATTIARACGMSERFIGLTIVAFGTSLRTCYICFSSTQGKCRYSDWKYSRQQYFQYTLCNRNSSSHLSGAV